jgi:hypothetical protein
VFHLQVKQEKERKEREEGRKYSSWFGWFSSSTTPATAVCRGGGGSTGVDKDEIDFFEKVKNA